jgi:ABC-type transport system involved in multi-copper enzyme maturation permease subunit
MKTSAWIRQIRAVARVEIRKSRRARRWIVPCVLAALPNLFMLWSVLLGVESRMGITGGLRRLPIDYARFFQDLWLRFMIFFSCAVVFSQLFRTEFLEKTLHHYYLTPIRREAVVLGKFLTAFLFMALLFSAATASTYFLFFWPASYGRDFLLTPIGISHMLRYVAITALACTAYGALFLLIGLIFRNPMIPALFLLCWETFNFALPSWFQHLSVRLYLNSFMPITILNGPLGIAVEPPSPPICAALLLAASLGLVWFCNYLVRHIQITYTAD